MKTYYLKEKFFKITDHYPILDDDKNPVLYVDQDFAFLGYKAKVSDSNKNVLMTITRKLISFLPTYNISLSDGSSLEIKENPALFKTSVDVIMEDGRLSLRGNFLDFDFDIYKDKTIVGRVSRMLSLADSYKLEVVDESFSLELIALCLCLNNIHDIKESN